MGAPGSDPRRLAVPALVAGLAVLVGVAGMVLALPLLARSAGFRPALLGSEIALLAPGLLAALALGVPAAEGLGLRGIDARTALLAVAGGATLWVASLGLFELQYVFWRPPAGYLEAFRRLHDALRPAGPEDALLSVLAIAVGPAVCEELLMRGVVLPSLWEPLGAPGAVVASSLLFGAIHLDAYRFPFTLVAGLALALLRVRTGSLVPGILAHAVLNTITLTAAQVLDDPSQGMPDPRPLLGTAALLAGAAASALVFRSIRQRPV